MMALLHSELIKEKHSYIRKLLVIFTLGVSVLALFLNGLSNNAIFSIYNWWYMMFLPAVVILISSNAISIDKKMNFANISLLPVSKNKSWLAKIGSVICYLFLSNLIIFVLSTIAGQLIGFPMSILNGLIVTIVLTITFAWQIPLSMFLVTRFNTSVTFLCLIVFNVVCSSQDISGGNLWWIPFSIPARMMAPILKMNPNGIPLDTTSSLNNYNVVIPGLLITVGLFALLSFLSGQWFEQKEIG